MVALDFAKLADQMKDVIRKARETQAAAPKVRKARASKSASKEVHLATPKGGVSLVGGRFSLKK